MEKNFTMALQCIKAAQKDAKKLHMHTTFHALLSVEQRLLHAQQNFYAEID